MICGDGGALATVAAARLEWRQRNVGDRQGDNNSDGNGAGFF